MQLGCILCVNSPTNYRAYWNAKLENLQALPFKWDAIHCKISNVGGSLASCEKDAHSGRCTSSKEAAAVACTMFPQALPPCKYSNTYSCLNKDIEDNIYHLSFLISSHETKFHS